jgi:ABC-type transport system involved in multi-copper enzyme maturation permease subunit
MTTAVAAAPMQQLEMGPTGTRLTRVIRSEWTKIWSVRSTVWTLLVLVIVTVGFSVLASWGTSSNLNQMDPGDRATLDPTNLSLAGIAFGQLAIAVLGAMIITSEYSTGGIKATLTAVPQRLKVLAAKTIVFAVVAFVVGTVTSFLAFFASMPFWSNHHLAAHLGDPGVLRAVFGGGLYLLASGLFGLAIGSLLRHTAGAITAAVALLLVVPPLTNLLPGTWGDDITKYFTSNAGQHIMEVVRVPGHMGPWAGYAVITVWWVVPLLAGAYLMRRRDA